MATTKLTQTLSASNLDKWTFSTWVKKSGVTGYQQLISAVNGSAYTLLKFETGGQLSFENYDTGGSAAGVLRTTRLFRDPVAWYHIVAIWDSDNVTAGNRQQLWVNGVRETVFDVETDPDSDEDSTINSAVVHWIGARDTSDYLNGVLAHTHFCDGQAYTPSSFGSTDATSGIWVPNTGPSVTYGTNGFFLKYASGALGTDSSGESNDFVVSGTMTPTKDDAQNNFATLNPLENYLPASTFSNGNNTIVTGSGIYAPNPSTIGMTSGKWYWETKAVARGAAVEYVVGISSTQTTAASYEIGQYVDDWSYYSKEGKYLNNNTETAYGDTYDTGDIIGIALDLTNNKLYFSKNNTWQNSGVPTSGATGTGALSITAPDSTPLGAYFAGQTYWAGSTGTFSLNFGNGYFGTTAVTSAEADGNGEGQFEYAPPTGYFALCTNNLGSES